MHVSYIRLRNWKNFKNAEAHLAERVFLIGPNASGKSNLLDAFRFLRDLATPGGGLAKAVDQQRGGVSHIRCLAATRYSDIDIEVAVAHDHRELWRYRLVFNQDNLGRPIVKEETVVQNGSELPVLSRPDREDDKDKLRLTQTAVEQIVANVKFRDLVTFFQSISYQHLIPQVVRDPRGFSAAPVRDDPFGRDFLLRMYNTKTATRDSRLRKITRALQVAVPQLMELGVEMDDQGTPHLVGTYEHWRPHAAKQYETQFSDGTLRLLGLLWTVFEGPGPLLLEEPELSLHAEVVRHIPQMFERIHKVRKTRRQVVLSTHSEDILRDKGISADEVLRLEPTEQGTLIRDASPQDRLLLESGLTVADVLLPKSAPPDADQLSLSFGS